MGGGERQFGEAGEARDDGEVDVRTWAIEGGKVLDAELVVD